MQRLLESGLLKDAGVFGIATVGLMTLKQFVNKPIKSKCFDTYPILQHTPFAPYVVMLHQFEQPLLFAELMSMLERFVALTRRPSNGANGFLANRLASEIPEKVKAMCMNAARSDNYDIAIKSINFERDELHVFAGICDTMVRNMLLSTSPYA